MTSVQVRERLVEALRLDLVGPDNDHPFAAELLPESPSRWYLTGFLVPTEAPLDQKFDATSAEEIDSPAEADGMDDAEGTDRPAANRRSLLPSSIGLSVLVPAGTRELGATVCWGDYGYEAPEGESEPMPGGAETPPVDDLPGMEARDPKPLYGEGQLADGRKPRGWRRLPRTEHVAIALPEAGQKPKRLALPKSAGLALVVTVREAGTPGLPSGTRAVSVFLVNYRTPDAEQAYRAFAFQAGIRLKCREAFVPRADPRGWDPNDDWDERVADLQCREVVEHAVGHGVSARAEIAADGCCRVVESVWIPQGEVERIAPASIPDVELGMEALAGLADGADAQAKLGRLVVRYREWLDRQRSGLPALGANRAQTANDMLVEASNIAARIAAGLDLLADPDVLTAFRLANKVVARSLRQRFGHSQGIAPDAVAAPRWYPFQVAYLLTTIRGIVEPKHADREVVDLIFFPTGGGKTEAYLALAAFTLVLRRLKSRDANGKPTIGAAGVSVLMRYTLRLLTLDQLGRAASLVCALELERQDHPELLGDWPFEIGLWVGQAATPNRMGCRGDRSGQAPYTAYTKTSQFRRDDRKPSPIPLEECPWCGAKFTRDSFRLLPNEIRPTDLRVHCTDEHCLFSGDRALPIVAVDEPIYRRLPCFVIATVDKFAALPWTGETGTLFGKVSRFDKDGFYGPCDPGQGLPLPGGRLPPPDLIIQDELHLISGPLGTIAGLYEAVVDALATVTVDGTSVRPKVVASTATVRRADSQIRALFNRSRVNVFPPPGPDRRDSFFARTLHPHESPPRLYIGVAAQGRSLKVVLLRAGLAVLSAGQTAWAQAGGRSPANPADPYMTLLGYFNSLRELGGSRRIVEDELRSRLAEYAQRRRLDPVDHLFSRREIDYEVLELTSRVPTNEVAVAKRRLALPFAGAEHVDVALATNMISVGLDITRLGLMMVLGQPKTCSEYIQATSRVGRDPARPGLVVTLLNIHKPRDRSHYERFAAFHALFYRNVEATSVTPFSPRALDRALPAALVALCRQSAAELTPARAAKEILAVRGDLDRLCQLIADRAREHKSNDDATSATECTELAAKVLHRCHDLLDDWLKIAQQAQSEGAGLQYQREETVPPRRLLYDFLDPELPNLVPIQRHFRANRSMRDVEASVDIGVKNLKDWGSKS